MHCIECLSPVPVSTRSLAQRIDVAERQHLRSRFGGQSERRFDDDDRAPRLAQHRSNHSPAQKMWHGRGRWRAENDEVMMRAGIKVHNLVRGVALANRDFQWAKEPGFVEQ